MVHYFEQYTWEISGIFDHYCERYTWEISGILEHDFEQYTWEISRIISKVSNIGHRCISVISYGILNHLTIYHPINIGISRQGVVLADAIPMSDNV